MVRSRDASSTTFTVCVISPSCMLRSIRTESPTCSTIPERLQRAETLLFDQDLVVAGLEQRHNVVACVAGFGRALGAGTGILDGYLGADERGARRIQNLARDIGRAILRPSRGAFTEGRAGDGQAGPR